MHPVNRWKMLDNLRRSLVAPMSLALLAFSLASGAVEPGAMLVLVILSFSAGPRMGALAGLAPSRDDVALGHFFRQSAADLGRALASSAWTFATLLQSALMATDAVARALWRTLVSRRHLLEWTTAAAAQAAATTRLPALVRKHWVAPIAAAALWAALLASGTPWPITCSLLCGLWALAPLWIFWVSRPQPARAADALSPDDRVYLGGVARDTWRLFERVVGPADHDLPPDNLQTAPSDMVAHRTSPTNIGLYLLATTCAHRFGWIGSSDAADRIEATLATLAALPRHRGHFLNWYDTGSAQMLQPMYVSTVDSGNLCTHLLAVAQAALEIAQQPFDGVALHRGLTDSAARIDVLRGSVGRADEGTAAAALLALDDPLGAMARSAADAERIARVVEAASAEVTARLETAGSEAAASAALQLGWAMLDHVATLRSALRDAAAGGAGDADADAARAVMAQRLHLVAANCRRLAEEADFSFLFHRKRRLFHIGFRVTERQLDAGFYDLLASEARATSLWAIAKGDVPAAHWAALGRPFYAVGALAGLRSWSGSMFEYLMPTLVLDEPHGSVLHSAAHAAVLEHIAYGREHHLPWGLSESAYAASDHTLAYQYAPQGVPRLALRRTPPDELVVAPYATVLAAQISAHRAVANLRRFEATRARERYGFIESLDYSPARQTGSDGVVRVYTFMAHHQGMSIVALANVLRDNVARRWGMGDARIEAVLSLLHERAPREVPPLREPPSTPTPSARRPTGMLREVRPGMAAIEPTHLLSNGRYAVALRANGAGSSRCGAHAVTRSRDDALRDAHGCFFYLRWDRQPDAVSLTQHPAPDAAADYVASFQADRVVFTAAWAEIEATTTVWVSPEDDIEFRRVELRNCGDRNLDLELLSSFEVTLADARADESHPAFSNLFVTAEWQAEHQALVFERKPRLAGDK
ncbi:MAG: glucoamylase family protein, partial [Caldimonas sp.]